MGVAIKDAREAKGLTRAALADIVGCHFNTIKNWELGNTEPDAGHLLSLSSALGCSVEQLLGLPENRAVPREEGPTPAAVM